MRVFMWVRPLSLGPFIYMVSGSVQLCSKWRLLPGDSADPERTFGFSSKAASSTVNLAGDVLL